jgi:hypothetical protein
VAHTELVSAPGLDDGTPLERSDPDPHPAITATVSKLEADAGRLVSPHMCCVSDRATGSRSQHPGAASSRAWAGARRPACWRPQKYAPKKRRGHVTMRGEMVPQLFPASVIATNTGKAPIYGQFLRVSDGERWDSNPPAWTTTLCAR